MTTPAHAKILTYVILFSAIVFGASNSLANTDPIKIVHEKVTTSPDSGMSTFVLYFDRAPDFLTTDSAGRQADSFQYFVLGDQSLEYTDNLASIVRGSEINIYENTIPIRHPALPSDDPRSGGWGEIVAQVPFDLDGRKLSFSVDTSLLTSFFDDNGAFYYTIETYRYGAYFRKYGNLGDPSTYRLSIVLVQEVNRIEAEDMQLDTYRVETQDFASDGALINLKGPGRIGSATTTFTRSSGKYDIFAVYHDEEDGAAQLTVSIAGVSVDSWTLDEPIAAGSHANEYNRFTRRIATDYKVNTDDEIRIDALQGHWDHANIDYLGFVPSRPPTPIRIEAEDMKSDTYRTESLNFASNGALINLKGPGLNGSATTAFPGSSGQYDVFVVYHDENDGVAMLTVSIAGVSLASWTLDQLIPHGQQPEVFNRFTRQIASGHTVSNGDEIRIDGLQGNWDHANVDYIEFQAVP